MSEGAIAYRERPARFVGATLWGLRTDGKPHRVLPDGCMDLIWSGDQLLVAGPDTQAFISAGSAGMPVAGVRFAPGTAPGLLGVPARELRNIRVPLADLWSPAQARRISERIARAPYAARALESEVLRLADDRPVSPPLGGGTASTVARVRQGDPVHAIASGLGLSERQLHRRCLEAFGYGLKTLGRILRMTAALDLGRDGLPLADVAVRTGYADQTHLTRDIKALTGLSPTRLLTPQSPRP
ncbi:helix-turn-helix domain-containing protein [Kribbella deserti]|uniref:Helix-turn-helix domain-containing protein n=1 Tax=Kribbella deserti TaxID=1926257 RepID=A0ABV6QRJ9_9ACTN